MNKTIARNLLALAGFGFLAACGGGGGGGGGTEEEVVVDDRVPVTRKVRSWSSFPTNDASPLNNWTLPGLWNEKDEAESTDSMLRFTIRKWVEKKVVYSYNTETKEGGTAASPQVPLSGAGTHKVSFRCHYSLNSVDVMSYSHDQRSFGVEITRPGHTVTKRWIQLINQETRSDPTDGRRFVRCEKDDWHTHAIDLEAVRSELMLPTWDEIGIRILFKFDTKDDENNDGGAGWFVDNIEILKTELE